MWIYQRIQIINPWLQISDYLWILFCLYFHLFTILAILANLLFGLLLKYYALFTAFKVATTCIIMILASYAYLFPRYFILNNIIINSVYVSYNSVNWTFKLTFTSFIINSHTSVFGHLIIKANKPSSFIKVSYYYSFTIVY